MRKIFVLDTNVVLHDPRAPLQFGDNEVVLPIYVVEELDQFKKDLSELGRNARECSRMLDAIREQGKLSDGVPLPNGGEIRIAHVQSHPKPNWQFAQRHLYDNLILGCAEELQRNNRQRRVVFVTKDTNLRIRADAIGLTAVDYDPEGVEIEDLYQGHREITASSDMLQAAFDLGIPAVELTEESLHPNEYMLLVDEANPSHTALARYDPEGERVMALPRRREPIFGITPRNKEQNFALDLLLDDRVQLVTLVGKAGTGKTLLALAASLYKVTEESKYQRVLVSRPIFPLGKDIGYLPGTMEEKLDPWMKPIHDNVEYLLGLGNADRREGRGHHELFDMGIIEIEPLTYIRGRSLPRQFLIVDEAQNLTPHEVKTIVTRAGEGTKMVFTGDPYQIDNPYVDTASNGLIHLVNKFQDQRIAGTVTLTKGERSELAETAANLL
jgi:PhoH-like ATPase